MNTEQLQQLRELANETAEQLASMDELLDNAVTLKQVCHFSAFLHFVGLHLNTFAERFPEYPPLPALCAECMRLQQRTLEIASKMNDYGDGVTANGDTIH